MSENPLPRLFSAFQTEAFRLETLPEYRVPEEREEIERYFAGESLPAHKSHREWLDALDGWRAAGKRVMRLRVVPHDAGPYLNFEIEWGYLYNALHGEDIYLSTLR